MLIVMIGCLTQWFSIQIVFHGSGPQVHMDPNDVPLTKWTRVGFGKTVVLNVPIVGQPPRLFIISQETDKVVIKFSQIRLVRSNPDHLKEMKQWGLKSMSQHLTCWSV